VEYFHVVFTLPRELAAIALQNKRELYAILMRASAETLKQIAADPAHLGADIGFISVLHTWGQNLLHHPHVHCVVPGGGLSADGSRWVPCRKGFFLPVRVLSRLFRGKFLAWVAKAFDDGKLRLQGGLAPLQDRTEFHQCLALCRSKEWVVYAKPPFGGPLQVLKYLARYTHRVAIANGRLLGMDSGRVSFRWKDHEHGQRQRSMTLAATEFIRRFLLHVLPKGFPRIRHYGLLANRSPKLARSCALLGCAPLPAAHADDQPGDASVATRRCPVCDSEAWTTLTLLPIATFRVATHGIDSS
jgi:hypothetical protein